ncbi:hypothetical protein LAh8_57 [Aeromonas phage LAh_8]|uniref:Uncharacterized protein n=1 Tax=Aeromonas phage LAh_8 TaxID=2591032 RepID=A0A514A0P4_9CAUD|nr:hypothetical protein HWC31_gp057 [Aeromonas phage LAh_8]QDH46843.1 hypothetical protein LAh8_57 [Aeromonas phage LAh_8]
MGSHSKGFVFLFPYQSPMVIVFNLAIWLSVNSGNRRTRIILTFSIVNFIFDTYLTRASP